MRISPVVVALVLWAVSGRAAVAQSQAPPVLPPDPADMSKPRQVPGFDPAAMDRSAAPCQDFYRFTCGGWLDRNPVPADRARYGRFDELQERNKETLRDILEKAGGRDGRAGRARNARPSGIHSREAAGGSGGRDGSAPQLDKKLGDFYAACMDEAAIEKKGASVLEPALDRIAAVKSREALAAEVARLHGQGTPAMFVYGAQPDFKQATLNIAAVDQGGLSLPDRDYYLGDDARFADVRRQYLPHVQKMFELRGDSPEAAAGQARAVLEIETALAEASLERVKRRDPVNRYHKMKREDLLALAPAFDWNGYFAATGASGWTELNVGWPDFFKGLDKVVAERGLEDWKAYLRWHVLRDAAPLLPAAFVEENFEFFGRVLTGQKELRPRWKRCVDLTDNALGELLGQRYVEATFGAEGKERMQRMVAALEEALERDIRSLPWMTEATKQQALRKLAAVANKIGYPETWRDYTPVRVVRREALANVHRAENFERSRDLAKIGKPVDPMEWRMTPPTVNAYYSPLENNINFPAGILQPPFFDKSMDDAVNFGGIGAVIGHELTHGFDDSGRKFAPNGNLADWWTEEDAREFEKRAACFADQYSDYTVAGGVKLNGRLTLGENVADNGGLRIAYMALQETLKGQSPPPVDGFTPAQRLFLGWGQIWCQNETEESAKLRAQIDPHSPGRYRVNGVVSNMPEFAEAFSCSEEAPMVRGEDACRVW
ncbi:MAG TPA: M13 family metallopeptidase [Vicinamibacteria bacterium]|nr:M13 family metallopeptidase [Vicinamibacteria bacterium]